MKKSKQFLSIVLVFCMLFNMFPSGIVLAEDASQSTGTVQVSIETKVLGELGETDILPETSIEIFENDTVYTVLERLNQENHLLVEKEGSLITSIGGYGKATTEALFPQYYFPDSGWMVSVNNEINQNMPPELEDGDQIRWHFSLTDYGKDIILVDTIYEIESKMINAKALDTSSFTEQQKNLLDTEILKSEALISEIDANTDGLVGYIMSGTIWGDETSKTEVIKKQIVALENAMNKIGYIPVTAIEIIVPDKIYVGEAAQLSVKFTPEDATDKNVVWGTMLGDGTITETGVYTTTTTALTLVSAQHKDLSSNVNVRIKAVNPPEQPIPVKSITIKAEGDSTVITTNGGTLQLFTEILPVEASNKAVTWSIAKGAGDATISQDGLLTATKNGVIEVMATATDGSRESGEYLITISGQTIPEADFPLILEDLAEFCVANLFNQWGYWDEWKVVSLGAYGYDASSYRDAYVTWLKAQLPSYLKNTNVKNLERAILALSALGMDASAFPMEDGTTLNFLEHLANNKDEEGTPYLVDATGLAYALSSYDSGEYEDEISGHYIRETIITEILKTQNPNGNWENDIDRTAMVVASMAPYYNRAEVTVAIDKALDWLSEQQKEDGAFASWGSKNSNSTSMVIIALSSLGIDADKDERFIKNGKSAVDGLLHFKTNENTFIYQDSISGADPTSALMATEQAFRALISYTKVKESGKPYHVYLFGKAVPPVKEDQILVGNTPIKETIEKSKDVKLVTKPNIENGKKTVTLPQIEIEKQQDGTSITLRIDADTKVIAPMTWNGEVNLPKTVLQNLEGKTVSTAIQVGADVGLVFDKPVRLLIPNAKNEKIGFIDETGKFKEITTTLSMDQSEALSSGDEGKIIVGNDVAVWTKHFTTFVAYTEQTGGGGGGNNTMTVSVSVTGDAALGTILSKESITVPQNSTAWVAIKKAFDSNKIAYENPTGNYISSIAGLAEFDKGPNSGWLYYINGVKPEIGVGAYTIKDGDNIELKYTQDHTTSAPNGNGVNGINLLKSLEKLSKKQALTPWEIFVLQRNGMVVDKKHFTAIEKDFKEKNGTYGLVTEYAQLAIALKSANKSIYNFGGYHLLEKICNHADMGREGVKGYIFSLIAMEGESLSTNYLWNQEKVIDKILEYQNQDGGFALSKETLSSVESTAMALTALAPYRDKEEVKSSIEKGLTYLKKVQNSDGTYTDGSEKSSESIAQVMIALCSLGIDPKSKEFMKNQKTLLDVLTLYQLEDGTFSHVVGGKSNEIATEQALIALTAYNYYENNKGSIYKKPRVEISAGTKVKEDFNSDKDLVTKVPYLMEKNKETLIKLSGITGQTIVFTAPQNGIYEFRYNTKIFTDTKDHWAKNEIDFVTARELFTGIGKEQFGPDQTMTRGMFITVLGRLEDIDVTKYQGESTAYDAPYIAWAIESGIVGDRKEEQFASNQVITREEMAVMISNYAKFIKLSLPIIYQPITFIDEASIAPTSKNAVEEMQRAGIMSGVTGDRFNPQGQSTRAEVATVLKRFICLVTSK